MFEFEYFLSSGKYLSRQQTCQLFLINLVPFIGFGFLDNTIMIIAGEYIDKVDRFSPINSCDK